MPRLIATILSAGVIALNTCPVSSQDYPSKPIRIITSAAGGGADIAARLIAQGISTPLGQQVIVDNRAGLASAELVSRAPSDGYTLLVFGGTFWLAPFMRDNVGFDPVKDFSPVTAATTAPNILVVHPSVPVTSVRALIALARAKPGTLNYAAGPTGSSTHLAAELFKAMTKTNIVGVRYKGAGPALIGLIGGETDLMFANSASGSPYVKEGRLRGLAVSSPKRTPLVPGLPTVAESGVPGYESRSTIGVFAPARTPDAVIKRLNYEIVRFFSTPETKEKFFNMGVEVSGSSPAEFAATVKSEMTTMGKVIKDAAIRETD